MSTELENAKMAFAELAAMRDEPLHPDLIPYTEPGTFGRMLRHPLIYDLLVDAVPGQVNKAYLYKKQLLAEYTEVGDWPGIVWLHERPYRLQALIDYCTGRDGDTAEILPLVETPQWWDLAARVWTDSENIEQVIDDWRALFAHEPAPAGETLWLGNWSDFTQLDFDDAGYLTAWRGGSVGDWSWTVDKATAQFFSRRSGFPVREDRIHRDECFGYLTHRSEYELLVRFDESRRDLIYPGGDVSGNEGY